VNYLLDDFHGYEAEYIYDVDDPNRLIFDGNYTYTYDAEGNRTSKFIDSNEDGDWDSGESRQLYTWDHRNRLTSITHSGGSFPGTSLTYTYDALNQLIKRTAGSTQTFFVYEDGQVVLEFFKAGSGDVADSNLTHRYLWGDVVDQLFADEQVTSLGSAGAAYWTMTDHQGTVRDVLDSDGKLRIHRQLNAFGTNSDGIIDSEIHYDASGTQVFSGASYITVAFGYTARWVETITGLQYNLHRWYDATTGSWISEDWIGFAGDPSNVFRYVVNAPTMYTDPTGLWWFVDDLIFAGGGAILGLAGQGLSDLVSGELSSWENYVGAAVGGAVTGETLLYTGNPVIAGAAGAAAGNLTTQAANNLSGRQDGLDVNGLAQDTAIGALTGLIPGRKIPGITSGRGSFQQVFRQMLTKLSNGTIKRGTTKTACKMFVGAYVSTAQAESGLIFIIRNWLDDLIEGLAEPAETPGQLGHVPPGSLPQPHPPKPRPFRETPMGTTYSDGSYYYTFQYDPNRNGIVRPYPFR
jgi:type VI secretion system secreted protein VgrG